MSEMKLEFDADDQRLSAYVLGELEGAEHAAEKRAVEDLLARSEPARRFVEELRTAGAALQSELAGEPLEALAPGQRAAIEARLAAGRGPAQARGRLLGFRPAHLAAAAGVLICGVAAVWGLQRRGFFGERTYQYDTFGSTEVARLDGSDANGLKLADGASASRFDDARQQGATAEPTVSPTAAPAAAALPAERARNELGGDVGHGELATARGSQAATRPATATPSAELAAALEEDKALADELESLGYVGDEKNVATETASAPASAASGPAGPGVPVPDSAFRSSASGKTAGRHAGGRTGPASGADGFFLGGSDSKARGEAQGLYDLGSTTEVAGLHDDDAQAEWNREGYAAITENGFAPAVAGEFSTFSIDVDTASYANVRRLLTSGQLPPPGAVRIEELVNYFPYDMQPPLDGRPFAVETEVAAAPWAPSHRLVRIGLMGRTIDWRERKPLNLVFLIDVSGSMDQPDKLPLLQRSLRLLVEQLQPADKVALTVYAGSAGLVLPPTGASSSATILAAIDQLQAGGSTAGGAGIQLAYATAAQSFDPAAVNRVVLCTDGDFNVGVSDDSSLAKLIEEQRKSGVFLSVLGFGTGNVQDAKMELLADKGNGNYAYVDTLDEARKVLVEEMGGTLVPIAKDVKVQVEFNPKAVQAWRLIGYENRLLAAQDFNDDTKDAGEIGAGMAVTALYEVIPVGAAYDGPAIDPSRYAAPMDSAAAYSGELLHVKLRYKEPTSDTSTLVETPVSDAMLAFPEASENLRWAASVAGFGMILRGSQHCGTWKMGDVLGAAMQARGHDQRGYRGEFLTLVNRAQALGK